MLSLASAYVLNYNFPSCLTPVQVFISRNRLSPSQSARSASLSFFLLAYGGHQCMIALGALCMLPPFSTRRSIDCVAKSQTVFVLRRNSIRRNCNWPCRSHHCVPASKISLRRCSSTPKSAIILESPLRLYHRFGHRVGAAIQVFDGIMPIPAMFPALQSYPWLGL